MNAHDFGVWFEGFRAGLSGEVPSTEQWVLLCDRVADTIVKENEKPANPYQGLGQQCSGQFAVGAQIASQAQVDLMNGNSVGRLGGLPDHWKIA